MTSPQKKKKNFVWYKNGKEEGINEMVDRFISNPHYDLEQTTEICLNHSFCNDLSLLSEKERQLLRIDILNALKKRIYDEKMETKKHIMKTLKEIKSSIENEIEMAHSQEEYMPSIDRYDMRDIHDVENSEYQISQWNRLYDRLEKEIFKSSYQKANTGDDKMELMWGTKVEVVDEQEKHLDYGYVMEADDSTVCVKLEKTYFLQNFPINQIRSASK